MRVNLHIRFLFAFLILGFCSEGYAGYLQEQDTVRGDTLGPYEPSKKPTYQPSYRFGDPFSFRSSRSPLFLRDPSQLDLQVRFNPDTTSDDAGVTYSVYENIGSLDFRPASFMTFEEFNRYNNSQLNREYFKDRSAGLDGESAVSGRSLIPRLYISPVFDRIFGGSYVDIQPNGFVNLDFGARFQRIDNPAIPLRQQKNGAFNFNQQISMNVVGKVGEKLAITANFDNNNTFDFQNNLKVEYTGYEEDIIKRIEIGNVSMPVSNSLMSGAQSLFGIKAELQFGKLYVTTVLSQQRGRNETLTIESGFQGREFEVQAADYEENRHFFLGHFFRDNYERWLATLPQPTSGVNVTRAEVYVLNRNNDTETTRNIVGFMDLGEGTVIYSSDDNVQPGRGGPTRNSANDLFGNLTTQSADGVDQYINATFPSFESSVDYVKVTTARKLEESEYKINRELGYITLTRSLQSDEILAVAYEYTFDGTAYKVGELTEDYQSRSDDKVIYLKLIRPNKINTEVPTWDLMMKNIYSLNAAQVGQEGFQLRIIYRDDATGQDNPSLHEGRKLKDEPLVEVFGLDRLNPNGDRQPDGNFDFIEGFTIDPQNGNIIFPVLEPFGQTLENQFDPDEGNLVEKYVFDELYEEPKATAELNATKNKFVISGLLTAGSSSEITLPGINIAEGSVIVTAGNTPLTEGLDYTVDYNLGRVRILNEGILSSGKTLQVSYEKADLFNFQTRTLTGARFDYRFNDNFNIGATVLHLNERPGGISRYAVGNEPTSNTKYGFDINYQNESRFLTKMVDALPMVNTKEPSTITINAELAQLKPGTSNIVNGEGTSYIDDFENAITPINIMGWQAWKLAATPRVFPEAQSGNQGLSYNYKKAKIAWYTVDNSIFYRAGGNARPATISDSDLDNHYERAVLPQEIFRQRDQTIVNFNEPIFDVAYFPSERGQYNYNPQTNPDNTLPNPEENWGGITRAITNEVNFNKTNIEYLEFWLMDPFIDGVNGIVKDGIVNGNPRQTGGGKLYFNLGSVSEDIAPDDMHAFENGLPADGDVGQITTWGQITQDQYLTNFFENSPGARDNQDVGIDGLTDADEALILQQNNITLNLNPEETDISADNFRYILDSFYDQDADADIVRRYKNWNGMENNSPIAAGGGDFIPASTTLPDNEDINQDNTISDLEEYFEYEIDLTPKPGVSNLDGGNLELSEYIVDQIESGNGESSWYLFRIPIKNVGTPRGTPSFENIKYIRMYLTDWSQPVVLRFAQMRLVGSQWRKFESALNEPGLDAIPNIETSDFSISVVSIEENSTSTTGGVRYVLPPGLDRDIDNTTPQNRRINEQSLQVCVEDLDDKDARAVYKNVSYDLINYGRMKMFFHAEAYNNDMVLDDEVTAFIRLGTDFDENYYEIEVPLVITPPDVSGSQEEIRRQVWPEQNEIDISIKELLGIKSERNRANLDENIPYSVSSNDGKYTFTVKGRPDISAVKIMMIGVKNPGDESTSPKSVCIWANELRVTDFDTNAGWAANARVSTKLADLGTISASTRYTSIGFGGIQQRISERSRAETRQYDISANLNLEKFLRPDKTGLVVPMFVSYEKTRITPQFDPLDPDVPLEASLEAFDSSQEREEYRRIVEDRTTRRSINFTNVRKEKVNPDARSHIYDVENLSFSYAYSDRISSNVNTQTLLNKTVSGGVNYNYSPAALSIEPFGESEKLSSPYFALIKDFNFSPIPTNFSFSTNLRRDFRSIIYYDDNLEPLDEKDEIFYERTFSFARNYNLRWDITKSLGFTYGATANALIDEPSGIIEGDINTKAERDFIWDQIFSLGRMKNFSQSLQLNYSLPLDKLPFTDWLSADSRYSVGYGWIAGAIDQGGQDGTPLFDDEGEEIDLFFGNTINNQRTIGFTSRVDMNKLYNKVTFLKNANDPPARGESVSPGNSALRFLMMLKSINGTYNINESTTLPGFKPNAFLLGLDDEFDAPGFEFILGSQDPGIKQKAATSGWLVENENLNSQFKQTFGTDIDVKADFEPAKDLRVQLTWNRGLNNQYQEIFRFNETGGFETLTPSRSGSYSISYLTINTAFQKDGPENSSDAFSQFEQNLIEIRERLNRINTDGEYDTLSQDVLIPSFLAAYSGQNVNDVSLTPFPKTPLPNWRFDYTGLINIPALSELFSSFTVSHGYNSTYSVSSFTNSLEYGVDKIGLQNDILNYPLAEDDSTGRLVPVYIINQVMISEQFVPLIGFNVRTKNNISTRLEFRKSRNLALNMSNAQVTETVNNDVTLDIGYSKVGFKLPWKFQGRTVTLENDLTMRVAASVRDSKTVQRKINDSSTITNGNLTWQVRPTITYKINNQLDFTFYMERNVTDPKVLSSYKRATTAFGVQLRFGLAQ
ncbi:cell surface protein SprA [Ekhidna sp.]|uniref:T9SS outer membrane translocon Sov/SprA n=1 Tax=Ekhidna sp. TaxID=2608089 RepID=UPI003BA98312